LPDSPPVQDRYEAKINADFVRTSIAQEIFDTLDHALSIRKMVVIEGDSGSGKTTAAEACARHQSEVRFATLSGITHKPGFSINWQPPSDWPPPSARRSKCKSEIEEFLRRTASCS
jgi:hypothetical protein